jgi:hypothetical protein
MTARLTDLPAITPARALLLKQEAAALKDAERIKQSAALARIAQREGFPSWESLVAKAGGREAVDEAKWDAPTDAMFRRAEKKADRARRFGSAR